MKPTLIECEVLDGLKPITEREVLQVFPQQARILPNKNRAMVLFEFLGKLEDLDNLRTVVAGHVVHSYPVPRPKAFLGHAHFTKMCQQIEAVISLYPPKTFGSFTIGAAGKGSSVFQRIREEIGKTTGLVYQDKEADLLLRFRPSVVEKNGWDFLVRVGPRPFSARSWRVFDIGGALNGTVAAAMAAITKPTGEDRFLNLMSGSGTLLVERVMAGAARQVVGVEIDGEVLAGARRNLAAAGVMDVDMIQGNAALTPFPAGSFNVICADLPWGQLMGSNEENERLYPALLKESARIAAAGARMVLLTHSIRLMERTLKNLPSDWKLKQEIKIKQGGLHPRMYIFKRV